MNKIQTDIAIIGGGLTGASLMLALQKTRYQCVMVDSRPLKTAPDEALDARSLALAPASLRILDQLGLNQELLDKATPIQTIHISQKGRMGMSRLKAQSEPLGQIIELTELNRLLLAALDTPNILAPAQFKSLHPKDKVAIIETQDGPIELHYRWLVAADGAQSAVRKTLRIDAKVFDFHQHAIVCNIALQRSHQYIAYERFSTEGPIAMLPLQGNHAAMIWALPPEKAKYLMQLDKLHFVSEIQQAFGYRLGRFQDLGQRHCLPLTQVISQESLKDHCVLIGSASQHLHPVAGQGFNLALRDVAALAQCFIKEGLTEDACRQFLSMRAHDRQAISQFTSGLIRLFSNTFPGASALRSAGLLAFDNLPGLKGLLSHYARGFAGTPPDLACGIPLEGVGHG